MFAGLKRLKRLKCLQRFQHFSMIPACPHGVAPRGDRGPRRSVGHAGVPRWRRALRDRSGRGGGGHRIAIGPTSSGNARPSARCLRAARAPRSHLFPGARPAGRAHRGAAAGSRLRSHDKRLGLAVDDVDDVLTIDGAAVRRAPIPTTRQRAPRGHSAAPICSRSSTPNRWPSPVWRISPRRRYDCGCTTARHLRLGEDFFARHLLGRARPALPAATAIPTFRMGRRDDRVPSRIIP